MAERRARHERPDAHPGGPHRERRERRHRLERPLRLGRPPVALQRQEEVVGDPHGVVAEPLGFQSELHDALHRRRPLTRQGEVVMREREPEPH